MIEQDVIHLELNGRGLLSAMLILPLLTALFLSFVPKDKPKLAQWLAGMGSFTVFLISLAVAWQFQGENSHLQLGERYPWVPAFGIGYILGVDGLSIWLSVLTTLLSFLVILSAGSIKVKMRAYLACLLVLETGMLGAFFALDAVLFYVFWELMLIPMYLLIGIWGGKRRIYAAIKFVLYTAFGSLLMLVAIAYIGYSYYTATGEMSFYLGDWVTLQGVFSLNAKRLLFAAFALAFAIKVPIFPLHTWLPDAHVEAPTGGSVILAGVLLKMGLYGMLRFAVPLFPDIAYASAPIFVLLGVIGIIYGALVAWVQTDMKKLVAYSSVSHLGFCVLGFGTLNIQGVQGCVLQMLNHGVSTAALFFLVGALYDRTHNREIAHYGGLASKVPLFSACFLLFTLSSIGLPLTNGFVGEFLILLGSYRYDPLYSALAVSGVILGSVYMLSLYRRVVFGEFDATRTGELPDLTLRERLVFAPLVVLVFFIGLYPAPILTSMEPTSARLVRYVELNGTATGAEEPKLLAAASHK